MPANSRYPAQLVKRTRPAGIGPGGGEKGQAMQKMVADSRVKSSGQIRIAFEIAGQPMGAKRPQANTSKHHKSTN